MALAPGTVIGQYRIDRLVGAGGMGEVYKATHLVLGRDVALKTLRPGEGSEAHTLRLIREARATSALQHPNIVTVYDVGDLNGSPYIAMEYVVGETLRQVLATRALRRLEAVGYGIQIANALAAAHKAGLLHRDVKPSNIMITSRNVVKVVDFGVAKRFDPVDAKPGELAETMAEDPLQTKPGFVIGTAAYMSPEQIRGQRVDSRSDVFSFGIVLYEMLTRVHPFAAGTDADRTSKILHTNPRHVNEIVADVPEELDDVVGFCLRKEVDERAQSMVDVAHILEVSQRAIEGAGEAVTTTPGVRRGRWLAAGGALALALVAGWAVGAFVTHRGEQVRTRPYLRRITWDAGLAESPALSNDGSLIAFASDRADGKSLDIFVRHTSGGEPIRLTNDPADDSDPSFSPDGGMIVFRSERHGGGIYLVPSLGGQDRLLVQGGNNPRFSPDGNWIAYWVGEGANPMPSGRLYVVPASGGTPRQLQPSFADARYPLWTPDSLHILFQGVDVWASNTIPDTDWWVTPLDSGRAIKTGAWNSLTHAGMTYIYPPGGWHGKRVVFSAQDDTARSLFEVPISTRTWHIESAPDSLTFGTGIDGDPDPAPSGAIAFTSYQYGVNIWSRDLDGSGRLRDKENRRITSGAAFHTGISASANGMRLVFLRGRSPTRKAWMRDLATEREASVDIDAADKCSAIISADGSRVAWSVCGPGPEAIYVATVSSDLSVRVPEKVCENCGRVLDWSRSGDSILFADHSSPVRAGILGLSTKSTNMTSSSHSNLDNGKFSHDGTWIAVTAAQTSGDRAQIFAIPVRNNQPAPESSWVAVTKGDTWDSSPVWSERSDAVLFYSRRDGFGCIWRQPLNPKTMQPEGEPSEVLGFHGGRLSLKELLSSSQSLSLAGDRLFFNALESTGSIWIFENTHPGKDK